MRHLKQYLLGAVIGLFWSVSMLYFLNSLGAP